MTAVTGSTNQPQQIMPVASAVATVPQSNQVQQVYNLGQMSEVQYEATRVANVWEIDGVPICHNKWGQRLAIPEAECKLYANNANMFAPSYKEIAQNVAVGEQKQSSSNGAEDKKQTETKGEKS